jgi:hypothetical protein
MQTQSVLCKYRNSRGLRKFDCGKKDEVCERTRGLNLDLGGLAPETRSKFLPELNFPKLELCKLLLSPK